MKHRDDAETGSRVLIVDDHPLMRDGIRRQLAEVPGLTVCGEAGTLAEARRLCEELRPDLVILDLGLPDGDAADLLRAPVAARAKVLAMAERIEDGEAALRLGATAFIGKRAGGEEFLRAVREVTSGRVYLTTEMIERLIRSRTSLGDGVRARA